LFKLVANGTEAAAGMEAAAATGILALAAVDKEAFANA
jgi:hypothetical protein